MQPKKKMYFLSIICPLRLNFVKFVLCQINVQEFLFDENGICSACNFAIFKRNKIDWELREKELVALCDKYRKKKW